MRPVSDRIVPLPVVPLRAARGVEGAPYAARAYARSATLARVGRDDAGRADTAATDERARRALLAPADARAALLAARPAAPGVETEVAIRVFADGGSISVVRHLRGGETVGIEALIR